MSISSIHTNASLLGLVGTGVLTGDRLLTLLRYARDNNFAIPAVNCISPSSVLACLEAARAAKAPVMIQFSNGGGYFFAGKSIKNKDQKMAIAGTIAAAHYVRQMAKLYGVPVVLHSDHCAKKLLGWFEGMVQADEAYFAQHGEPLFSSHMLDLSEESMEDNIRVCERYLKRFHKIDCLLEMELGITGGEEDGVDNSHVDNSKLYTQPDEVWQVYQRLSAISHRFTIASAFGNVHGVYKPGNVQLRPENLAKAQAYIKQKLGTRLDKPVFFVFHGGSGSEKDKIKTAIQNGVVKMNIDTDTQWAFWNGVRKFEAKNRGYLQGQIGNPTGADKPNKKKYDPRAWLREGEKSMSARVQEAFKDLNCWGVLDNPVYLTAKL
jgi:fructose-bisphosphate aldolase class II